jgi:hypothetical protein
MDEFRDPKTGGLLEQCVFACTPEQAAQLLPYDHHTVRIGGRLGVMLTYPWMTREPSSDSQLLTIVFAHAEAHPPVPPQIQAIVDRLADE